MKSTPNTTAPAAWSVGTNGNMFADIAGWRYCVDIPRPGGNFTVYRNGKPIAAPGCVDAPPGFTSLEAAQQFAELYAGRA